MTLQGLRDLLADLADGELSRWELVSIEQLGPDDEGEAHYAAVIALGPITYRLTSYMPPAGIKHDIAQRLQSAKPE